MLKSLYFNNLHIIWRLSCSSQRKIMYRTNIKKELYMFIPSSLGFLFNFHPQLSCRAPYHRNTSNLILIFFFKMYMWKWIYISFEISEKLKIVYLIFVTFVSIAKSRFGEIHDCKCVESNSCQNQSLVSVKICALL